MKVRDGGEHTPPPTVGDRYSLIARRSASAGEPGTAPRMCDSDGGYGQPGILNCCPTRMR